MISRLLIHFSTFVGAIMLFVGGEISLTLRAMGYITLLLTAAIALICDIREKK